MTVPVPLLTPKWKGAASVLLVALEQIVPPWNKTVAVPFATGAGMLPNAKVPPSICNEPDEGVVEAADCAMLTVFTSTTLLGLVPMMNMPASLPLLPPVAPSTAMFNVPIMALTWPLEKSTVPLTAEDALTE